MFTGIIQAVGSIQSIHKTSTDCRLQINTGKLEMHNVKLGDSIAVNGVCLTAVTLTDKSFIADVSNETLSLTTLAELTQGSRVNLEKALTLSTPLGGHLVSGHVDGLGQVINRISDGLSERFTFAAPANLAKYIAHKGSICVDGVSLTVNAVNGAQFELNIVPHTLTETIMSEYSNGKKVNLEVDLLARYLERLMLGDEAATSQQSGITHDFLQSHGFTDR